MFKIMKQHILIVSALSIKEIENNKYIKSSFVRIQLDSSLMCGYICIRSIDFILNNKSWRILLGYFYQKIKKKKKIRKYQLKIYEIKYYLFGI